MNPASLSAAVGGLSLSGAFFTLLVWIFSRLAGAKIGSGWRKAWVMLLPIAFLAPLPAVHEAWLGARAPRAVLAASDAVSSYTQRYAPAGVVFDAAWFPPAFPWFTLWLVGAAGYLALVLWRTAALSRYWSRKRLSTDPVLLGLLETCKEGSGVTAPIGIVVSDEIGSPALLGWLRPRILLPTAVADRFTPEQLRSVLFHELAHFKALDIPLNWLFLLVRAVHWFNPLAHAAAWEWNAVREEAADAAALRWLRAPSGEAYGEVLLSTLKAGGKVPFGAMAIGETLEHLKRRIHMIQTHSQRRPSPWLGGGIAALLLASILIAPGRAQDDPETEKKAAVAAMEPWLKEIDGGNYAQSWQEASAPFKRAVAADKWNTLAGNVRTPLGACNARNLASALCQSGENNLAGLPPKGIYVVAQFDSSFANLKQAVETVTFEREADGVWRASGYFIKPGAAR